MSQAFQLFALHLGGTPHDAADLLGLAENLKDTRPPVLTPDGTTRPKLLLPPWTFPDPPPLDVPIDTFVGDWLRAGSIVGRGRRGLDVLVIRTPGEQLEHLGLIDRKAKKKIGRATEKTVSAGYGVRLLPDEEDERLRKDARRTWSILGKLTLNLPCFGLWMPTAYWDLFQQSGGQGPRRWDLDGGHPRGRRAASPRARWCWHRARSRRDRRRPQERRPGQARARGRSPS